MRVLVLAALVATSLFAASSDAFATGLATCESGDPARWQKQETLQKFLEERGWRVRRIKVDGGCYEVYAFNERGERVEAYFHPVTLAPVPTMPRR